MKRLAGVDPGRVRVGLAIADDDGKLALPRPSVSGEGSPREVARRIRTALADFAPERYVVGLPLTLGGGESKSTQHAKTLARAIRDELGVEVAMADERLTTVQATRGLNALGVRGKAAREAVDSAAAVVLLQSALERRKSRSWQRSASEPLESEPTTPSRAPHLPAEGVARAQDEAAGAPVDRAPLGQTAEREGSPPKP